MERYESDMMQDIETIIKAHLDKKKYELEEMQLQSFFVSSTFIDMQGERDALHQVVLPRLREKAAKYGNSVQFIDLRWGISTQDMDSEEGASKIMEVCLDEIESCKPYMIILLGERYGWMPSVDLVEQTLKKKGAPIECYPMSITEMEIQYAMLLNSGHLERCVFCFREPLPIDKMGLDEMMDMLSLTVDESQRLEKLKDHIRQTEGANILEYGLEWDDSKMQLTGYEAFAEQLAGYLEQLLERDWGKTVHMSWQKKQYQEDMMLRKTLNSSFFGRSAQVEKSLSKLKDTQVYILEAEGGSGKSAFISEMARKLEESHVKTHVIYCGNSSNCTTVGDLLEIIGWRLGFFVGTSTKQEGFSENRRDFYYQKIREYDEVETVVFIDAIDQLYWDDALFQSWYMPQELPDNLKIVITTTGVVQVNPQTLSGLQCVKEELTPPEEYEIAEIIVGMFEAEHKQISKQTLLEIQENPCSNNMLALSMMVRRLSMLNRADFQKIHEMEKNMDGDAAIRRHLSDVIAGFPKRLEDLADYYMWEVSNFLTNGEEDWTNMIALYLIAATENGLSREDFENLMEFNKNDEALSANTSWYTFWNELKFARMRRFLGPLLIQKSDGKIDFTHRLIREGLRTNHVVKSCAIVLLNYFIYGKIETAAKYESGLILCRQLIDKEKEDKESIDATVYNYLSVLICDAGNLFESDDPEESRLGKERLSILQKSVLRDVSCENGHKHLNAYCDAIRQLIRDDASPRNWVIWFFDNKIAQSLWNQSDDGRTTALQIYLAVLEGFMKPEKKQLRERLDKFESQVLCRIFFYTKRLQRTLTSSITHARIYGENYGYTWEKLTEDGLDWFGKHLKKYPDQVSVYGNYTAFLIDQADILSESHGAKKYFKLVENALAEMKAMLDVHYDRSTWRMYIRRLAELSLSYRKKQWAGLTGGKKYLVRADELSAEAVRLYELLPAEDQNIRYSMIVYRNRAQILAALDKTADAVQMLWQVFEKVYPEADTLSDNERLQFSWTNMLLLEYLFRFRKVFANGKNKYEMSKAILRYEAGYIRTNVNVNFNSRYHWARILQIRAYCKWYEGSGDYENDLAEAKVWLQELAKEQEKDSRGIDGWRYHAKNALNYDITGEIR